MSGSNPAVAKYVACMGSAGELWLEAERGLELDIIASREPLLWSFILARRHKEETLRMLEGIIRRAAWRQMFESTLHWTSCTTTRGFRTSSVAWKPESEDQMLLSVRARYDPV